MVAKLDTTVPQRCDAEQVLADLRAARERTLALVAHLRPAELEASHSPIMSPLVWDLAHIAAYEDLWLVHRHAEEPLLHPELAVVYDAFETPRAVRNEIELLDTPQALAYLAEVRSRTVEAALRHGVGDGFIHEMVLRHELQHTETMLQTMAIASLLPPRDVIDPAGPEATKQRAGSRDSCELPSAGSGDSRLRPADPGDSQLRPADPGDSRLPSAGGGWIELDGGSCSIGAGEGGFSYDNERPRHEVALAGFRIARAPVSNGEWRDFCEQGGYERSEHWSAEGWSWRRQADPLTHPRAGAGADDEPVCHVCLHEAEAFASWRGARLPSEAEWEHAAASQGGELPGGRRVWEWTSSELHGYPGFLAYPYREYSETFFGKGYVVLRGGSWATSERVARVTFRNWDLPIRRQIFAGIRLATDA